MNLQNITTIDLLIAFFSGVGATFLGFFLTLLWEWRKGVKQELVVIQNIKQELLMNCEILKKNLSYIEQELSVIDQGKAIVIPLSYIIGDFSNLLTIGVPKKFRKDPQLLIEIRKLSALSRENNESLSSRETYRIHNGAMSNFNSSMKIYGQIIQSQTSHLLELSEALISKL